jgi:RecA-family ATPase
MLETELGLKGRDAFDWFRNNGFERAMNETYDDKKASIGARGAGGDPPKIVDRKAKAAYSYTNERGELAHQTLRLLDTYSDGSEKKAYTQRRRPRPDDSPEKIRSGWVYSLNGSTLYPYRLPQLQESIAYGNPVFYVEGEKCAEALVAAGVPVTTTPMGAGKFSDGLIPYFADADIIIIPDCDANQTRSDGTPFLNAEGRSRNAGIDHANLVASKLQGTAKRVRVLELPGLSPGEDVVEWLQRGGDADKLYRLVDKCARDWRREAPLKKLNFEYTWFHEVAGKKVRRDWLVKNLVLAKSLGVVYGQPGSGKSFLVQDMMLAASAASVTPDITQEWFGHKVKPFGVIYVVAEGSDDFDVRMEAWRNENKIPRDAVIPFVFLATDIDMRSGGADTAKLAEDIKSISAEMEARCGVEARCVVIDTVSRVLCGGNENSSDVMGMFVINCGMLQKKAGVCVIGIHHGGKEAGRGPRGHEALHGAADFELEVTAATEDGPNTWTVRKMKYGPGGETQNFRLAPCQVEFDEDEEQQTTCVVRQQAAKHKDADEAPKKEYRPSEGEASFLHVLADAIDTKGVSPPSGGSAPSNVFKVVQSSAVKDLWIARMSVTESGTDEQIEERLRLRWARATKRLVRWGVIQSDKPYLWFSGVDIRGIKLRGAISRDELRRQAEAEKHLAASGGTSLSDEDAMALM